MMELLIKARALAKDLQKTPEYESFAKAKEAYEADKQLQEAMKEFQLLRIQTEYYQKEETAVSSQKLKESGDKMQEIYQMILSSDTMKNYQQATFKMNEILKPVQEILTAAAQGLDPETFDPYKKETHFCSGNCGECNSCK